MTVTKRPRALAAILLALVVGACGSSSTAVVPTRTSSPSPSVTASVAASPTASPTTTAPPSQLPILAPIPVSVLAPAATASKIHLDDATAAALQKALDSARSSRRVPGLQAAVVFPDGSIWTGQSGVAVRSPSTAVTQDTLFAVGSISKTFTAALALRLAGRGTIGLDDPISKWVPSYPNAANITVRQLLSHTSGLQDLFTARGMADAILAQPHRIWTADQVLDRIGKPYFAPGKGWRYSNTNYLLLGVVIEKATGKTVAEQVRTEFLEPLGLERTFLQTEEKPTGALSHGYKGTASRPVDVSAGATLIPFESEVTVCGPAGAYASTAGDIARWSAALYGGAVLDDASLAAMADVSISTRFKARPYGLGFEQRALSGRATWGHLGALDGYTASMKYLPDLRVTIVVLANSGWASPASASASLLSALLATAAT
jgi:D-alanyl-D-alanine carboxypeptidase